MPYRRNYCITLGWLNAPLRAIRFFETLELVITAVTGAIPRADDLSPSAPPSARAEDVPADAPRERALRG